MSTSTTEATPALQTPHLPVTAFERLFGHPPGLVVLFFAGMWERFAFFGASGLLKLYMANYLFFTPVALSLLTKLAPARVAATMMALWMMSSFLGNLLSGYLGVFSMRWSNEAFCLLGAVLAIGAGAALVASSRARRRIAA